jgi:PKD repeat protein
MVMKKLSPFFFVLLLVPPITITPVVFAGTTACDFDSNPPPTPTLLSPVHNTVTSDSTPTFDWTDVTDDCSAVTYIIEFNSNATFDKAGSLGSVSGLTASTYTQPSPWSDHTKYWRVKAVDDKGNVSAPTAAFKLTIDTTPPVLTVPSPLVVEATTKSGAFVEYTATATDSVAGSITPLCVPPSGSTFPLGTTTVTCSAKDTAGNSAQASFTITVTPPSPSNNPPLANAGLDKTVNEGTLVTLNGNGSDPDGDPITFSWTQVSGPTVTLQNANTPTPTFTAPNVLVDTVLTFRLTVSDGLVTSQDTVSVTVRNIGEQPEPPEPPVARISVLGGSYEVNTAISFSAASSHDPDGQIIGYSWNFGDNTISVGVTVTHTYSNIGTYTVTLRVTDNDGNVGSTTTTVVIMEPLRPQSEDDSINLVKEPHLERNFVLGEVLVGLKAGVDPESDEVLSIIEEVEGQIVEVIEEINLLRISVPQGKEQDVIDQLKENDFIRFSSKNRYLVPTSIDIPDPDFSWQRKHYEMINLPQTWDRVMGRSEVIVAVLDSGIDISHSDLQANVWNNDDSCSDGLDNDSNGFTDDCRGWNFANSSNDVLDEGGSWPECDGHGTHVSGIIGAMTNEVGGLGVAPYVTIMPVKVSANEDVEGDMVCVSDEARVVQGIIYATDNGAKIINASLGCGEGEKCEMQAVGDAFQYAHNKRVLVVVAAGNEREHTEGIDDWQDYAEYVIEVSSIDLSGELARYSNIGSGVKLSAPGTSVYSTKLDERYGIKSGTSQAAPLVSGCSALLLSADQSLTNTDLENLLLDGARDLGDRGRDDYFGYGLLDCGKALTLTTGSLDEKAEVRVNAKQIRDIVIVRLRNMDGSNSSLHGLKLSVQDLGIEASKTIGSDKLDWKKMDSESGYVNFSSDQGLRPSGKTYFMLKVNGEPSFSWEVYGYNGALLDSGSFKPLTFGG